MTNKIDPKSDWDMIAKMADEQATRGQIAELYGVTPPAIAYILKQMGKSSVAGERGRKAKGYSLADSPSPTLRKEARRRGLIAKKQKPPKAGKSLPETNRSKNTKKAGTETGTGSSSSESDEKFKPWEYGTIYDPEEDRLVSSEELIQRATGAQPAGRAPRAKRKPRKATGGRGKTSKSGRSRVPETSPSSGTEETEYGAGEDTERPPRTDSEPSSSSDEAAEEKTAAEPVSPPGETAGQEEPFTVPQFLKKEDPSPHGRPRIRNETIVVGGQGRGYREVAVQRISTGRARAGSGAGLRESANLTQLIQSDIVRDADRLKELCDILTEAAKGPTAPRNTYRQEVANKVREIQKAIADIEGTLLKL